MKYYICGWVLLASWAPLVIVRGPHMWIAVGPTCGCVDPTCVCCGLHLFLCGSHLWLLWAPLVFVCESYLWFVVDSTLVVVGPTNGGWWDLVVIWSSFLLLLHSGLHLLYSYYFLILRGMSCNLPSILLYLDPRDTVHTYFVSW